MGYCFISYSTQNQAMADAIRNTFIANKIDTWMAPYSIPPGSKYAQSITNAIRNCSCFVLLLSNASQASEAVDSEVELAALTFKKNIVTVQIENVVLNDAFTFYIHNKQILPLDKVDVSTPSMQAVLSTVISFAGQTLTAAQQSSQNTAFVGAQPTQSVNGGAQRFGNQPNQGGYQNNANTYNQQPTYSQQHPAQSYQHTPAANYNATTATPKSRIIAALLAIFLGGLGLQHFYLKKPVFGVLSIIFFWTYIPGIVSLVQGIMWLCSDDRTFNSKYNS